MATLHFTQYRIDTLKPRKVILDVRDTELKGFGIRIMPSGARRCFIHSQHEGRRLRGSRDREGCTLRDRYTGSPCPLRTALEARHAQGQPDLSSQADPALLRGSQNQCHYPAGCRSLVPVSPGDARNGKPVCDGPFRHHAEGRVLGLQAGECEVSVTPALNGVAVQVQRTGPVTGRQQVWQEIREDSGPIDM